MNYQNFPCVIIGTTDKQIWSKNYICKHVVGVCEVLDLHQFSERANQIQIGQKRSRGRPKNTASALQRQTGETPLLNESRESQTSEFDLFDDNIILAAAKPLIVQPVEAITRPSAKNSSVHINCANAEEITVYKPQTTKKSTNDTTRYCIKCSAIMQKRLHFYCPNKCKQK